MAVAAVGPVGVGGRGGAGGVALARVEVVAGQAGRTPQGSAAGAECRTRYALVGLLVLVIVGRAG